ncbi:hypothetical protein [Salinispora arenicola]|uniref:hypothetical protein n=1 Tax=Salinispora arenicola TaxID=168697 RepID=UPI0012BCEB63|nr:hypothetical protein [Salinispora arenicola]
MTTASRPKLVDLWPGQGEDTAFYLAKGLTAMAEDASPHFYGLSGRGFPPQWQTGRLVIVNVTTPQVTIFESMAGPAGLRRGHGADPLDGLRPSYRRRDSLPAVLGPFPESNEAGLYGCPREGSACVM